MARDMSKVGNYILYISYFYLILDKNKLYSYFFFIILWRGYKSDLIERLDYTFYDAIFSFIAYKLRNFGL